MQTGARWPGSADQEKGEALQWCRGALGPASADRLGRLSDDAWARARADFDGIEDFVLGALYPCLIDSDELRREFFGYLWGQADFAGFMRPFRILGRYLETGDVLASSFGDMMELVENLEFRGKKAYFSMARQRLIWKAHQGIRRTGREAEQDSSGELVDERSVSLNQVESMELRAAVLHAVHQLSERDRTVVRHYLEGRPIKAIAQSVGLSEGGASKALQRALGRLRPLLLHSGFRDWGRD
jgi:RNA polymerase sigma factor (sigma-70 family)